MWPQTFADRLQSWNQLRSRCATADCNLAIELIDAWWRRSPWCPYHLHWDDRSDWPDPWQLLDDNVFCDLARGLGMLYTITLVDRADLQDSVLTDYRGDNLVLINSGKYILNWSGTGSVNINPDSCNTKRFVTQQQLKQQLC